jgi:valyl-tRNA synthetase
MDSKYNASLFEEKIYAEWENSKKFEAKIDKNKKPFSIILPPPNANADLHVGHGMYVYEDIMCRYKRLMGHEVLWLPGADHAGFETQFVFEKHLKKQGKSRFDYSRDEFYKMVWEFVQGNRGVMEKQLRRLGFSLDWSKQKFTLDPDIVRIVYQTFKKLFEDGLVYRGVRLVNYCTRCGTGFSDLEVDYVDRQDPLYYLKYGPFVLATTRPETKFGDTGVAVHPDDIRYQQYIGKEIEVEGLLGKFKIKVIADKQVDPEFGTGVVKVTPAHDFIDFEMGQRHNLPLKMVINYRGRLTEETGKFAGMKVVDARKLVIEELMAKSLVEKIDDKYSHRVGTCYKCGNIIEPLPMDQWFVNVGPLKEKAIAAIEKGETVFYPTKFKDTALMWLNNFKDWNISRQIVWGMQIPAWQCQDCHEWIVTEGEVPDKCTKCGSTNLSRDTDTFDTWFSSGQWPFATLQSNSQELFNYFYPTSVMETGYDILPWWVCRMMMLGIYKTGKVPFEKVFLHGTVRDSKGQKMSKSKGNVINPMVMIDKYGADALRGALVFQASEGADISFSEDKMVGMRNFGNKIWNIARFININLENAKTQEIQNAKNPIISDLEKEFTEFKKKYFENMEKDRYSTALTELHEFIWHRFADFYIEQLKEEIINGNINILETLKKVYLEMIVLLHPFMPFITEAIWKVFEGEEKSILDLQINKV